MLSVCKNQNNQQISTKNISLYFYLLKVSTRDTCVCIVLPTEYIFQDMLSLTNQSFRLIIHLMLTFSSYKPRWTPMSNQMIQQVSMILVWMKKQARLLLHCSFCSYDFVNMNNISDQVVIIEHNNSTPPNNNHNDCSHIRSTKNFYLILLILVMKNLLSLLLIVSLKQLPTNKTYSCNKTVLNT